MSHASDVIRIACWSGPRNISTAMMRAWENRPDTAVVDEPFYAHYLAETGLDHPGREDVLRAGERDWREVVRALTGPVPGGKRVFYQKHMAHHQLPRIGTEWFASMRHALLIRDPREVLLSYVKGRPTVAAEDLGIVQEARLYDEILERTGEAPLVLDAGEFLRDPARHLRAWCARIGIAFTERMLAWPAGRRATDGVWAPHWYAAVEASMGFEPWRERDRTVPAAHAAVIAACMPAYERLFELRLR